MSLGCLAILCSFGVAYVVGSLEKLTYSVRYGVSSQELVRATITELEAGRSEHVLATLRSLDADFSPSYETPRLYDELVDRAVLKLQSK
ncbi:MAG: hypothetical protein C0478_11115 [Planctomyces sp.]|nr:hypothetical protein [Planctomyces sp.]